MDSLFSRLASVGLTVLAPKPEAWELEVGKPGIVDIRFAEDEGVAVLRPLIRPGDLETKDEALLRSGVVLADCWYALDGGCRDFAFDDRGVARRDPSPLILAPSARPAATTSCMLWIEVEGVNCGPDIEFGPRLCVLIPSGSASPIPIDLRGPFEALLVEIGGYWLLGGRIAIRPVGGSMFPAAFVDTIEDMLALRFDVLSLLCSNEPLLPGRVVGGGIALGPIVTGFVSVFSAFCVCVFVPPISPPNIIFSVTSDSRGISYDSATRSPAEAML